MDASEIFAVCFLFSGLAMDPLVGRSIVVRKCLQVRLSSRRGELLRKFNRSSVCPPSGLSSAIGRCMWNYVLFLLLAPENPMTGPERPGHLDAAGADAQRRATAVHS
jgi:hypothetical protein